MARGLPRRTSAPIPGLIGPIPRRRRPALGEDDEDVPVAHDLDERPEVARCPGGAAAPELLEAPRVLGRERLPEQVGVGTVEDVSTAGWSIEAASSGPCRERRDRLLRDELGKRVAGRSASTSATRATLALRIGKTFTRGSHLPTPTR